MLKTGLLFAVAAGSLIAGADAANAQTAIPPSPEDFVMAAAQSDQYEIQAAMVAQTQSHDPNVQAFAHRMIEAHSRTSDALRQAAQSAGLPPPEPGMSSDQASLLASLQSLRGSDFNQAYAKQQVLAHKSALAVEESFAASGGEPHLKAAAQAAVPTIRDHLQMATRLRDGLTRS